MKDTIEKLEKQVVYVEWMIDELRKCINDPIYFINSYIKVMHPKRGVIGLTLNEGQIKLLEHYHDNRFSLTTTARQSGQSTVTAAYMLWTALFKENYNTLFVSNKLVNAKATVNTIRDMYEALPTWLKPKLVTNNMVEIKFDNGSKILAQPISRNTGKGMTLHNVILDQIVYTDQARVDEFYQNLTPCLASTNGKFIVNSTPNDKSDEDVFSRLVRSTIQGNTGYKFLRLTAEDFGKDEPFKIETISLIGQDAWDIEYDCKFVWERN